jgi:hypothetical protein
MTNFVPMNAVYKNCKLLSRRDSNGYHVQVIPMSQSNVTQTETMTFQNQDDAFAEAKKYIDSCL